MSFNLPIIIAGDVNLNLLNPNNNGFIDMYINNLFELNMRPLITKPTKVNLTNQITRFSILDQIWVTEDISQIQSFILPVEITDHFPVCVIISSLFSKNSISVMKKRQITARGKESFSIFLSNVYI